MANKTYNKKQQYELKKNRWAVTYEKIREYSCIIQSHLV